MNSSALYSLIVDSGNSFVKVSILNQEGVTVHSDRHKVIEVSILKDIFNKYRVDRAICSAVRVVDNEVVGFLKENCRKVIEFSSSTPIPIQNHYSSPSTLGVDRLAAAIGVAELHPGNNSLIIDLGTAITIDFVEDGIFYKGGNISPGANLRFKSLNAFTDKLPLCQLPETNFSLCGSTTVDAITSGVVAGILFEIEGYIKKYSEKYSNLKVVFTGGDALYFGDKLKIASVECDTVTKGLFRVLKFNDDNI